MKAFNYFFGKSKSHSYKQYLSVNPEKSAWNVLKFQTYKQK